MAISAGHPQPVSHRANEPHWLAHDDLLPNCASANIPHWLAHDDPLPNRGRTNAKTTAVVTPMPVLNNDTLLLPAILHRPLLLDTITATRMHRAVQPFYGLLTSTIPYHTRGTCPFIGCSEEKRQHLGICYNAASFEPLVSFFAAIFSFGLSHTSFVTKLTRYSFY